VVLRFRWLGRARGDGIQKRKIGPSSGLSPGASVSKASLRPVEFLPSAR